MAWPTVALLPITILPIRTLGMAWSTGMPDTPTIPPSDVLKHTNATPDEESLSSRHELCGAAEGLVSIQSVRILSS
jgi:hypothetical protein